MQRWFPRPANAQPKEVITDKLPAYREAIVQELPNANHYRYKGFVDSVQNNKIERFHGTFRERDKVMRGLKSVETAKNYADAYRNYYNFVRPHSALNGLTPAQAGMIALNSDGNRWLELLKNSK